MSNIRCLLVDDEHLALALLEKFIQNTPGLEVAAVCKSPVRAIEILQSEPVDLLFLDIQMPVISGLNLLKSVSRKPVTVFTTAYPQHAADAFDLDAADYLLKPYSFERFTKAVEKAMVLIREKQKDQIGELNGSLNVKSDRQWVKIPFSEIIYIEGWKEYVKIYLEKEKIVTLESLNNLESILPAEFFLRVHKSYIVAKSSVQRLDGENLVLGNKVLVPVARARKKEVIAKLFTPD